MSGKTDQAPKADTTGSSFPDDVSVNGAATLEPAGLSFGLPPEPAEREDPGQRILSVRRSRPRSASSGSMSLSGAPRAPTRSEPTPFVPT